MMSEERVLRFFAFLEGLSYYDGKLNKFLNNYMQKNRYQVDNEKQKEVFESTTLTVKKMGVSKISKSTALQDAVLYGIAKNSQSLKNTSADALTTLLEKVKTNPHFSTDALGEAVMKKRKVNERLVAAELIFSNKD